MEQTQSRARLLIKPVTGEFSEKAKSCQVAHAVKVNFSIQVIPLVLDHARVKARGDKAQRNALAIPRFNFDALEPGDSTAQIGDAETALPVLLHIIFERRDTRIYKNRQGDRGLFWIAGVIGDFQDGDLPRLMYLICGKTNAVILLHGFNHIIDKALDRWRLQFIPRQRLGRFTKHWMSEPGHLENRHTVLISTAPDRVKALRQTGRRTTGANRRLDNEDLMSLYFEDG